MSWWSSFERKWKWDDTWEKAFTGTRTGQAVGEGWIAVVAAQAEIGETRDCDNSKEFGVGRPIQPNIDFCNVAITIVGCQKIKVVYFVDLQ